MATTQSLVDAINENSTEKLSYILVRLDPKYLNIRNSNGETPLYMACRINNIQAVSLLLTAQGINVNLGNCKGATPLHRACGNNSSQAVLQLLAAPGINVNAKNEHGETPLHMACTNGNTQVIAPLLAEPGINVNIESTKNGCTPIMYAAKVCNIETLKIMLDDPRVYILHTREKLTGNGLEDLIGTKANSIGDLPSVELRRKCLGMIKKERRRDSTASSIDSHRAASTHEVEDPTADIEAYRNHGYGSEEFMATGANGIGKVPSDILNEECLEMIKVEKQKTESKRMKHDYDIDEDSSGDDGQDLEEIRENVRIQYLDKIDKLNKNVKSKSQHLTRQLENKKTRLKEMKQRQTLEMKAVNNDLDKEKLRLEQKKDQQDQELNELRRSLEATQQRLSEIQQKIMRNSQEIMNRHQKELTKLEEEFKPEEDKTGQELANMKGIIDLLTKDLQNLDMDYDNTTTSNDHKNLEAARKTLECPVCMELMRPPVRIWMCPSSHIICEPCKNQVEGRLCPTCRTEIITQRALIAEHFSKSVFTN